MVIGLGEKSNGCVEFVGTNLVLLEAFSWSPVWGV